MDEPDGSRPQEPNTIRASQVVGGIFAGLIAAFLVQALLTMILYSTSAPGQPLVPMWVPPVLPGVVGVALLVSERTRQAGAGALLGLAVGSIIAAGVCTAVNSNILTNG